LGARDFPWVMWALRSFTGRMGMTLLSLMGCLFRGMGASPCTNRRWASLAWGWGII